MTARTLRKAHPLAKKISETETRVIQFLYTGEGEVNPFMAGVAVLYFQHLEDMLIRTAAALRALETQISKGGRS